jgi:hypothetical protein
MASNVAEFRTRFPEFADDTSYPDARITMFLEDAQVMHIGTGEIRWGNRYNRAQLFIAAHLLYVATSTEAGDPSGKAGAVLSKTAGSVSVTRAASAQSNSGGDDFFLTTSYGQQYIALRNTTFVGAVAATNG